MRTCERDTHTKLPYTEYSHLRLVDREDHGPFEFLQRGQTINTNVYRLQLDECHKKPRLKQPALVNKSGTMLLYDDTHVSIGFQEKT
ncbi:hypothetical protein TNCV_1627101 [Trichonephila clavipes]|nr:hypothetical protein TNCV_1627101 [Trichonephila clavipes]